MSDKNTNTYDKFSELCQVINSNVFLDLDLEKLEKSKKVIMDFAFRILKTSNSCHFVLVSEIDKGNKSKKITS